MVYGTVADEVMQSLLSACESCEKESGENDGGGERLRKETEGSSLKRNAIPQFIRDYQAEDLFPKRSSHARRFHGGEVNPDQDGSESEQGNAERAQRDDLAKNGDGVLRWEIFLKEPAKNEQRQRVDDHKVGEQGKDPIPKTTVNEEFSGTGLLHYLVRNVRFWEKRFSELGRRVFFLSRSCI